MFNNPLFYTKPEPQTETNSIEANKHFTFNDPFNLDKILNNPANFKKAYCRNIPVMVDLANRIVIPIPKAGSSSTQV